MSKVIWLFAPGIFSKSSNNFEWIDRAGRWIDTNTDDQSCVFNCELDAIFRRLQQQKKAQELATVFDELYKSGKSIRFVGHSNACDLFCRAIKLIKGEIDQAHLISGACDSDFKSNGINDALSSDKVDKVFVYASKNDKALQKARAFSWLNVFGLGYGYLGLVGPSKVQRYVNQGRVITVWKNKYDHSDWFKPENFDFTMKMLRGDAERSLYL